MPPDSWFALLLFIALLLAVSLHALAASGQFPREHRAPTFRSATGAAILFGTIAASMLALFAGLLFAAHAVPWYAAVIGGGASVLFTPLVLRPLPDAFVNGRAALLSFSAAAVAIALAMLGLF